MIPSDMESELRGFGKLALTALAILVSSGAWALSYLVPGPVSVLPRVIIFSIVAPLSVYFAWGEIKKREWALRALFYLTVIGFGFFAMFGMTFESPLGSVPTVGLGPLGLSWQFLFWVCCGPAFTALTVILFDVAEGRTYFA